VTGVLARAALVAVAIVAVAWLGHGVRALDLAEEGRETVAAAGQPPDAGAVESALASFRAASRRNPDPAPSLDEATLLLAVGRTPEAVRVLEEMTRVNRGNVRAWGLLAAATAQGDPERSQQADRELRRLYGRVQPGPVSTPTLRAPDGRLLRVVAKPRQGLVEYSRLTPDAITLRGWAADTFAQRRVDRVLVASRSRVVAVTEPRISRPGVARLYGEQLERSGFDVTFPRRSAEDPQGRIDVRAFAVSGDEAAPLRFFCEGKWQDIGC
jgi:hypothetical protein